MALGSLRIVVFDAVGTLIYPDPPVAAVYASAGQRCGSRLTEPEVAARFRAFFGEVEARDRAGDLRTSEEFERARWQEVVRRVLDDLDAAGCFDELFEHFARPSSWRVYPEVPAVFAQLATLGVGVAIASNFDGRLFRIAREVEPLSRCKHVLVSSQIGYRKPHRRFFETILAALHVRPGEVLYVGDDPDNDAAGARSAGMYAVQLDRRGGRRSDTIASLSELFTSRESLGWSLVSDSPRV